MYVDMQPLIDVAVNFTYRIEHEAIPTLLLNPIVQLLLLISFKTVPHCHFGFTVDIARSIRAAVVLLVQHKFMLWWVCFVFLKKNFY
jgi:hypothetical protein